MHQGGELSGRRVTVMGLGLFGGGAGAIRYLLDRGARVTLTDLRSAEELRESLESFDLQQFERVTLGRHDLQDFTSADLVVVNPAVPRQGNPFLLHAQRAGIPLTSEMNLFWEACPARKLVVTGTVGKSTTATLIHQILTRAGQPCRLGGNIGISLLPKVDEIRPDEWIVLELSSFQLADLASIRPRPEVSVITNFSPNHLDWHGSLEAYRQAKQETLRWQATEDTAVLNHDDHDVRSWPVNGRRVWAGRSDAGSAPAVTIEDKVLRVNSGSREASIRFGDLAPSLQSTHGQSNASMALAATTLALGVPIESARAALAAFQPLPHRLEQVRHTAGRTFINDSKATTPQAALAALRSLKVPVILIAGGKDKGADLEEFAREIAQRVKFAALMGETAPRLLSLVRQLGGDCSEVPSLEAAVALAWERSSPGDVILLSPGSASFGDFRNFEERGNCFTLLARACGAKDGVVSPS